MKKPLYYLVLQDIKIQDANAISSPITYGFPALTGFLGAIHALSRYLASNDLFLGGVIVGCSNYHLKAYRTHNNKPYKFAQARNPLDKSGKTTAIIEEGKINLTITIVIEVIADGEDLDLTDELDNTDNRTSFLKKVEHFVLQHRMAGGVVNSIKRVKLFKTNEINAIKRMLFPSYILIDAKDDFVDIKKELKKKQNNITDFEVLLETTTLLHKANPGQDNKITVESHKRTYGWLCPIPVGYQTISKQFAPGELENCRTNEYPSQYVEPIYSLGKWVFANKIEKLASCFWRYHTTDNLFLIKQN